MGNFENKGLVGCRGQKKKMVGYIYTHGTDICNRTGRRHDMTRHVARCLVHVSQRTKNTSEAKQPLCPCRKFFIIPFFFFF